MENTDSNSKTIEPHLREPRRQPPDFTLEPERHQIIAQPFSCSFDHPCSKSYKSKYSSENRHEIYMRVIRSVFL